MVTRHPGWVGEFKAEYCSYGAPCSLPALLDFVIMVTCDDIGYVAIAEVAMQINICYRAIFPHKVF